MNPLVAKNTSLPLTTIPRSIAISPAQPTQPAKVFTANLNGTVTMFEFEELKEKKLNVAQKEF